MQTHIRLLHGASVSLNSYVCWYFYIWSPCSSPPQGSLSPESRDFIETSWSLSFPVHCLTADLCICFYLKNKTFLIMVEKVIGLWIYENVIRSHIFFAISLVEYNCFWLWLAMLLWTNILGPWTIFSEVTGFHFMECVFSQIRYWLITTYYVPSLH